MTENREIRRVPATSLLYPCFLSPYLIITLSLCLEFAAGLIEVFPEEFLDLSPGVLLGRGVCNRVSSPEQGNGKVVGVPGSIAQRHIGGLYEVACPGVDQHPCIASPMTLQLVQCMFSIFFAIGGFVILSYNEEDLTLGLFNRIYALLIPFIPRVPLKWRKRTAPKTSI